MFIFLWYATATPRVHFYVLVFSFFNLFAGQLSVLFANVENMSASSSATHGSVIFGKGSQSGTVIIVSAVLTGLSTIVVLLRLYTRQFILKTAGADDWTMGLAQLLSIAAGTSTILGAGSPENFVILKGQV